MMKINCNLKQKRLVKNKNDKLIIVITIIYYSEKLLICINSETLTRTIKRNFSTEIGQDVYARNYQFYF